MFNLIVKDPCGCRLSGPFWIEEYTALLCVLELAALHVHGLAVF
jgi:hypothetical protein